MKKIKFKNSRRGIGKLDPVVSNVLILTAKGLHHRLVVWLAH